MISRGTVASIDLHQRIGNWLIYDLAWLYRSGGGRLNERDMLKRDWGKQLTNEGKYPHIVELAMRAPSRLIFGKPRNAHFEALVSLPWSYIQASLAV